MGGIIIARWRERCYAELCGGEEGTVEKADRGKGLRGRVGGGADGAGEQVLRPLALAGLGTSWS